MISCKCRRLILFRERRCWNRKQNSWRTKAHGSERNSSFFLLLQITKILFFNWNFWFKYWYFVFFFVFRFLFFWLKKKNSLGNFFSLRHEQSNMDAKIKDNTEKINLNRKLPHLIGHIVEVCYYFASNIVFSL